MGGKSQSDGDRWRVDGFLVMSEESRAREAGGARCEGEDGGSL